MQVHLARDRQGGTLPFVLGFRVIDLPVGSLLQTCCIGIRTSPDPRCCAHVEAGDAEPVARGSVLGP